MTPRIKKLEIKLPRSCAAYVPVLSDVFYLSGFSGTSARIIATRKKSYFITDSRYEGLLKKLPEMKNFETIITKTPFEAVKKILSAQRSVKLSSSAPLSEFISLKNLNKQIEFNDPVSGLRQVKDQRETALIKKSASITAKTMLHLVNIIKPGISEKDLAFEFEFFAKKQGAESLSFSPIIAFNSNSAIPHHETSGKKLKKNTLILIDAGVKYRGYCSDLTRCIAFCIIDTRLKEIKKHYNIVKKAKNEGIKHYMPGKKVSLADKSAGKLLDKHGLKNFFTHSLGHGTGIDIHEPPYVSSKNNGFFKSGNIVTCEPGIYFKGKYGIRIEDDYLITPKGPKNLSSFSDRLIIIS